MIEMLKGFTRKFRPLEILTEEVVEAIHTGTLGVLQETGVRIEHERGLKLLEENGCEVDFGKKRVRFPPGLVEESLRKCPSAFRVKARDPKNDLIIGGNTTYFKNSCGMKTVDLDTMEPRTATRKENYDGVTVLDALENHHLLAPYTPYFGFENVPPVMAMLESCAGKIRNSTKVQCEGYSQNAEIFTIKMAKAVEAETIGLMNASPPLTWYFDAIESAYRHIEAGFPLLIATGEVIGGTGPATIAGSIVTSNAEDISGIVLAQLIKPGTRVFVCSFTHPMEMRSGSPAFGDIGVSLYQVAFNQIWRKYEIPRCNNASGYSSSKTIDFQSGYEKAIMSVLSCVSGANLVGLHGGVCAELTYHPVQSILDDDIAGMIGRFIEGIEVSAETLALDLIEKVGPIPGFYLDKEHTRNWWKKGRFFPKVADRLTYPEWTEASKKSCLHYAKERMEEILAKSKPTPLTEDTEREIGGILEEARKYYKEKGLM